MKYDRVVFMINRTIEKIRNTDKGIALCQSLTKTGIKAMSILILLTLTIIIIIDIFPHIKDDITVLWHNPNLKFFVIASGILFIFFTSKADYKQRYELLRLNHTENEARANNTLDSYYREKINYANRGLDIAQKYMKRYQSVSLGSVALVFLQNFFNDNFHISIQSIIINISTLFEKVTKLMWNEVSFFEVFYFIFSTFICISAYKYMVDFVIFG